MQLDESLESIHNCVRLLAECVSIFVKYISLLITMCFCFSLSVRRVSIFPNSMWLTRPVQWQRRTTISWSSWRRGCRSCRAFQCFPNDFPVLENIIVGQHIHNVWSSNGDGLLFARSSYFAGSRGITPIGKRNVHVVSVLFKPSDFLHKVFVDVIHGDALFTL